VNVSVVPAGVMAVVYYPLNAATIQIATVNLDGSNLTPLTSLTSSIGAPQWRPDGSLIVFQDGDPNGRARIYTVDLTGHRQRLISQPPDSLFGEDRPRFAGTNDWVYFNGFVNSINFSYIWRVRADGTGLERLPPWLPMTGAWQSDPSPDDTHVLYDAGGLYSLDIASGTSTFVASGWAASWSPDGSRVAYLTSGTLSIMNADGSGTRPLSTVHKYDNSFVPNWSSDGQWIVLRGPGAPELIRVATGDVIPLPFAKDMYQPSLKP
jgi:Tol biopolymer transport system component